MEIKGIFEWLPGKKVLYFIAFMNKKKFMKKREGPKFPVLS